MILITADLHFNDNPRDVYRHDFVNNELIPAIKKHKVDELFILGDLTEEKDRHGAYLVHRITEHIYKLSQLCKISILKGNHDYTSPAYPFFAFLGRMQNVRWFTYPEGHPDRPDMLFLPHANNYKRDWVVPGNDGICRYRYVFAHSTFDGAIVDSGQEIDGVPWGEVFEEDQIVFSGDVHVPQQLGPILYVGSPYPINFGDHCMNFSGDLPERGLLLFNPDDYGAIERIPYKGPRKIWFEVDLDDRFDPDRIGETDSKLRKGDIVKISVRLHGGDFGRYQEYKRYLTSQFSDFGCTVYMVQPVVERGDPVATDSMVRNRKDDLQVLKNYAEATGVSEPVRKTGVRIMKQI